MEDRFFPPHDGWDGMPLGEWYLNPDRCAPECDDQLPLISRAGRGIKGNGYQVRISDPDTVSATYLEGWSYDEATKQYTKEWTSENINGGHLTAHYNLRPYTIPQCFTITFIYRRDNRPEWSWTTPAIPYIWDTNGDGQPDTDEIIGSGLGDLWIRESIRAAWQEQLVFPPGTTNKDFNSPMPLEPWSGNITFGWGGDMPIPNLDDLSDILGWDRDDLEDLLDGSTGSISGSANVKAYIDALQARVYKTFADILNKIYQGGSINQVTGAITWPNSDKIPIGNLNLYSGGMSNWIRTRADGANDLRAD